MPLTDEMEKLGAQFIPCAGKGELWLLDGKNADAYAALKERLIRAGCILHDESRGGNNLFSVLAGKDEVLTLSFIPHNRTVRLVREKKEQLPARETGETVCAPLLTQVKLTYFTDDCGMAYILRLVDGRFICIDGGLGMYDDAKLLYDVLTEQNVLPKIRIAAWFITHPHDDHIEGFASLIREYGEKIELERLLFNWPRPDLTGKYSNMERFNRIADTMPEKIATPHSGQRFFFPGAQVDVLYACDDLYPQRFDNINDSSMVLRITMENRRILMTGDAQQMASAELCARYDSDTLKSEFLQVPHHGYWGGSPELFALIDPETVLWPCPDVMHRVIKDFDCNRFFKDSKNICRIIVGGREQAVLDMTKPVPEEVKEIPSCPVLLRQHFETDSMTALGFSSVVGGPNECKAPKLEFPEKGYCRLSAGYRAAVELLKPHQLRGAERIRVTITGKLLSGGISLWWEHPIPVLWPEEDKFVRLTADQDGSFKHVFDFDLQGKEPCGLYLVMEKAELELNEIEVIRIGKEDAENET